jgi:hypothetical protein
MQRKVVAREVCEGFGLADNIVRLGCIRLMVRERPQPFVGD